MNSTNETLLFDRFLIMYNLCFHLYYRHVCISLYTCANVICIKLLLTYLLTYSVYTQCILCFVFAVAWLNKVSYCCQILGINFLTYLLPWY